MCKTWRHLLSGRRIRGTELCQGWQRREPGQCYQRLEPGERVHGPAEVLTSSGA